MLKTNYSNNYPHIFSPFTIGKGDKQITFKNRMFVAPTHLGTGIDGLGMLNNEGLRYFENFADGGFAGVGVPLEIPPNSGHPRFLVLDNEDTVAFMDTHKMTRYAHAYDCRMILEINHPGCCMMPGPGRELISASSFIHNGHPVREMNEDDMENVIQMYIRAAFTAKRAGFDMIMLHFAHGWLMNNFLSPLSNKRQDQYGGSVENRCRFPKMVIDRVKEVVDLPIELRLNGSDGMNAGGITPEDAAEQILIFQDSVDMIHLTCGTRLSAETRGEMFPSHFLAPAHNRQACIVAKKAGAKIPIGIVGGVHDPDLIEEMLKEGEIDYALMGRQATIEPHWVNKVKENRTEDIKPCLRCGFCNDYGRRGAISKNVTFADDSTYDEACLITPLLGQGEEKKNLPEPKASRKVAVIGGGIAGMEAAIRASQRGHRVTLFEKTNQLAGQLNTFKDYLWFKKEFIKYVEYMTVQLQKSTATVLMNTEATPKLIKEGAFDAVIVAIGSKAATPNIPGVDAPNVFQGREVYARENELGKKVVIVGGGLNGCEAALYLADKQHEVTVVEMGEYLAANAQLTERTHTLMFMEKAGVKTLTNAVCKEIRKDGLTVALQSGEEKFLEGDSIVLSVGSKALDTSMYDHCAPEVYIIGDCDKPGNLMNATHSAWDAASVIL